MIILFAALLAPVLALAQDTIITPRVEATIDNNGDWELTDSLSQISWHGQWITATLMKVTGTDSSCFVIGENETGMVQLDCTNLRQISILLSYNSSS